MGNYLNILKKALKDPKLEGLNCVCPNESSRLIAILESMSPDACISEWRYGMGKIKYEYHMHINGVAGQLKEAYRNGARGGHPKLTTIYSRKQLKRIIQEFQVGSESRKDTP